MAIITKWARGQNVGVKGQIPADLKLSKIEKLGTMLQANTDSLNDAD